MPNGPWKKAGTAGKSVEVHTGGPTPGKPDANDERANPDAGAKPDPAPDWQGPGRLIKTDD